MATPSKKISAVRLPSDVDDYTIVPIMVTDSTKTYKATVPTLTKDSTILLNQSYTTKGDILYASSAEVPTRLGIGSTGQVLTVSSNGVPTWANAGAGTITDVTINNTSIVSNGVANFNTITAYNASTNKIATQNDIHNGTLTIQSNGTSSGTFTANQSDNTTINLKTAEVIDVTNGVTEAIKNKITANPAIMLKYESFYYMPQYDGNDSGFSTPNYYNCFEGDSGTGDFHWLYINWTNYTVEANTDSYATRGEIPSSFNLTDDILDGSANKYAPYTSKGAGHLYTGTTAPSSTNRLNYDGYFYATKLYSGGSEVKTTDNNQTVKGNGTTFGANDAVDIVGAGTVTVTADTTNKKITITGSAHTTDHNQTVKGNGTAFDADDAVNIVGDGAITVTADTTNKKITISTPSVSDTNQKVKAGSVTFGANDTVNFTTSNSNYLTVSGNDSTDTITLGLGSKAAKVDVNNNFTASQTISTNSGTLLTVNNSSNNATDAWIGFKINGSDKGFYGVNSSGEPLYWNTSSHRIALQDKNNEFSRQQFITASGDDNVLRLTSGDGQKAFVTYYGQSNNEYLGKIGVNADHKGVIDSNGYTGSYVTGGNIIAIQNADNEFSIQQQFKSTNSGAPVVLNHQISSYHNCELPFKENNNNLGYILANNSDKRMHWVEGNGSTGYGSEYILAYTSEVTAGDNKNLYHLGAYDTTSGNTITRKTGYIYLDGSEDWQRWGGETKYYLPISKFPSQPNSRPTSAVINHSNFVYRNPWDGDISFDLGRVAGVAPWTEPAIAFRVDFINNLGDFKSWLSKNPKIIEYELSSTYQYEDDIIENYPLNTLDSNGSAWLRSEWEKGINLLKIEDTAVAANDVSLVISNGLITTSGRANSYPQFTIAKVYLKTGAYTIFRTPSQNPIQFIIGTTPSGSTDRNILDVADNQATFNITTEGLYYIGLVFYQSYNYDNYSTYITLNKGDYSYPYQPYDASKHFDNNIGQFVIDEWEKGINLLDNNIFTTKILNTSGNSQVQFALYFLTSDSSSVNPYAMRFLVGDVSPGNVYSQTIDNDGYYYIIYGYRGNQQDNFIVTHKSIYLKAGTYTFNPSFSTFEVNRIVLNNVMFVRGDHAYPYAPYYGEIARKPEIKHLYKHNYSVTKNSEYSDFYEFSFYSTSPTVYGLSQLLSSQVRRNLIMNAAITGRNGGGYTNVGTIVYSTTSRIDMCVDGGGIISISVSDGWELAADAVDEV